MILPSATVARVRRGAASTAAMLLMMLAVAGAAPAVERFDVFTVASVPVDATAADANAARDAARRDGERHAYQMLLERLTLASDRARLPPANDAVLDGLVRGFEVANERTSGVRYLAQYTFHFRADGVRQLLRQAGIPFAETPSKPLLVLPVLLGNDRPVLWDDPNPWRDAWLAQPPSRGLVPLVMPLGELEDVAAIDAEAALNGDDTRLQSISQRYGGADVLVARAAMKSGGAATAIEVTATRFTPGAPGGEQTWTNRYAANPGESDGDLMARAAEGTVAAVEEAWKAANSLNFNQTGTLVVSVPMSSLDGWITVRDRLNGIPAVQRSELLELDRRSARVALHFVGDPAQLRLALAQSNLELSGNDPDWVLQPRGAAAPR